jgi:curved DNA-binding protein CbpA
MAEKRTHYEVLGVSPQATDKEIKAAYRKRARETHPDFGGSVEAASAVNEAADVLLDAQKRAGYDYDMRKAQARQAPGGAGARTADPFAWTRTPPPPPGPTVVECPHCQAKNRVKTGAMDDAKCGVCKKPLKDSLGSILNDFANEFGGKVRNPLKTVDDILARAEAKLRETREAMDKRDAAAEQMGPTKSEQDAFGRAQSRLDELDEWERKLK